MEGIALGGTEVWKVAYFSYDDIWTIIYFKPNKKKLF